MANKEFESNLQDKEFHLNLQELIENYVWMSDMGKTKSIDKRKKYKFDIHWGYVDFHHDTKGERQLIPSVDDKTALYFTEYLNKTNRDQKYTFSIEKETVATTKIELQEYYTLGAKFNLEISLPGVIKIGVGAKGSVALTNTTSEDFTETLNWNINTEIIVAKKHKVQATLYVSEEPSITKFVVTTTLSLPKGRFPVEMLTIDGITKIKNYWIESLHHIFPDKEKYGDLMKCKKAPNGEDIVVIETCGTCRNVSWKNQNVEVKSERLQDVGNIEADDEEDTREDQRIARNFRELFYESRLFF